MLRKIASVAAVGAAVLTGACDNKDAKTTETRATATATTATTVRNGDAQALAMLTAINQGEIDQANAAKPKLANDEAKTFADMMLKEHSEALANLSTVANEQKLGVIDNATSRELKSESAQLVGKIGSGTAGPALDRMYMQAQVDGHTKALKLLDNDILPSIDNMQLKTTVTELRAHVQEHLSKAQATLQGMPAS